MVPKTIASPVGLEDHALQAHLNGLEPSPIWLTTRGSAFELQMQVVQKQGVEPWSPMYQTGALTVVLLLSGQSGNRTPLSQCAKLACHLNIARDDLPDSNRVGRFAGGPSTLEQDDVVGRVRIELT